MPLLEGPHVLNPLKQAVDSGNTDQHIAEHAARNKGLHRALRERRRTSARIQIVIRARKRTSGLHQIKVTVLAPHLQLLVQRETLRSHARVLHVRLERGSLLAVLRQARHKRQRRIGENTNDISVVGRDRNIFMSHEYSIVPDKPSGSHYPHNPPFPQLPVTSTSPAVSLDTITLKGDHRKPGRILFAHHTFARTTIPAPDNARSAPTPTPEKPGRQGRS